MSNVQVRIENPPDGYRGETSMRRAERYVRAGRAVFVGVEAIRFLASPMQAVVERSAEETLHARMTGAAYDRVGGSFYGQARRLPLLNPEKMMRGERSARDWSFSVATRGSIGRAHTEAEVAEMRRRGRGGVNPSGVVAR